MRCFQCLPRRSKSVYDIQLSATADAFNNYILSIPLKTVVNVASTVYKLLSTWLHGLCDEVISTLEFVPVSVDDEAVSSFIYLLCMFKGLWS